VILLHGLGGAKDLPVPAPLAIAAGGIALLASFTVLAVAWRQPRYTDGPSTGRRLPPAIERILDSAGLALLLRLLGLAFFGYVTWALIAGPNQNSNPALGVFYVLVWVGVIPASLLFGRVARALSPARTIDLVLARLIRGRADRGLWHYPEKLGTWPAAIGLLAFVWQELVNPDQVDMRTVQTWLASYLVIMLLGATAFGDVWFERADPFEVYSNLLAGLSVWGRDDDGHLVIRSPLANLARLPVRPGLVAVVAVLFGSTAFDSYKDSLTWVNLVGRITSHPEIFNTVALVVFCAVIGIAFTIASTATPARDDVPRRLLPDLFAHSVVPIVVGYMVAHYLSFLVEQGQITIVQLSDPMADGANLLGTAGWSANLWLSAHPTFLATTKVLAVVAGHVVGIIAAHDRALAVLPERRKVTGQIAMLVLMICYTTAGLYLLFGS
jgi:hypothetical protein